MVTLKSIDDLIDIKRKKNSVNGIQVCCNDFYRLGLLSYVVKYSFVALKKNGDLILKTKKSVSYDLNGKESFWKVARIVSKVIKDDAVIIKCPDTGEIKIKKKTATQEPKSIGIGYLASNVSEIRLLLKNFEIYRYSFFKYHNESIKINFYILTQNDDAILNEISSSDNSVVAIPFHNPETNTVNFPICQKKNLLFRNMNEDIRVIAHSRIQFREEFFHNIFSTYFEFASPKVDTKLNGGTERYLDFKFVPSNDYSKPFRGRVLSQNFVDDNYYYLFRHHFPVIDGGVFCVNTLALKEFHMDESLMWGEAEDDDICFDLSHKGYIVDYLQDCLAFSSTRKTPINGTVKKKLIFFLLQINKQKFRLLGI